MVHKMICAAVTALLMSSQAVAGDIRIADGTKVSVRLMERVSSESAHVGDVVNLEVAEDLMVDGVVVVKQGTPAKGKVSEAQAKRRMGRAGRLAFLITETKSADGRIIRLRSTQSAEGESHVTGVVVTTTVVAVLVPVAAPFMLMRHGQEIGAAEGTRYDTFVDGDHVVRATTVEPSIAQPATAGALTNKDIVAMSTAGLGDDVLLAKIATSSTSFDTSPETLIQLKKSGLSDRLLAAMAKGGSTTTEARGGAPRSTEELRAPAAVPLGPSVPQLGQAYTAAGGSVVTFDQRADSAGATFVYATGKRYGSAQLRWNPATSAFDGDGMIAISCGKTTVDVPFKAHFTIISPTMVRERYSNPKNVDCQSGTAKSYTSEELVWTARPNE